MAKVAMVPIDQIVPNKIALRAVDTSGESYIELRDSIKEVGLLESVSVRERTLEDGSVIFELINGLHRYTACKELGLTEIMASIHDMANGAVMEAQIIANANKIETKPMEYTRQLYRILQMNPLMTERELSQKLGKSPAWINGRLKLTRIKDDNIKTLINEGKISLSNATALSGLPEEEQPNFVEDAMVESPDIFIPRAAARVKEINEAARKGQKAAEEFTPVPHLQKMASIKDEMVSGEIGTELIISAGIKKPVDAFKLALKWVLNLDDKSVASQKAKWDAKQEQKKIATEKRKVELAKKRVASAEGKAQEAKAEAEAIMSGKPLPKKAKK